jgi:TolA-binding protein
MTKALLCIAALAVFGLPSAAVGQGGTQSAHIDARLSELQRTLAKLSAQVEQLKTQNQQLQQRMEKMQTSFEQRIGRLEKGPAAKPVPRSSTSKQ